jgi:hypothetical protein
MFEVVRSGLEVAGLINTGESICLRPSALNRRMETQDLYARADGAERLSARRIRGCFTDGERDQRGPQGCRPAKPARTGPCGCADLDVMNESGSPESGAHAPVTPFEGYQRALTLVTPVRRK